MIINTFFLFTIVISFIFVYSCIVFVNEKVNVNKNAVIGLIRGYKEEILLPFLITLRNASPSTNIIAFTDNYTVPIIQKYFKPELLNIIEIMNEYPYYPLNCKEYYIKKEDLMKYIPTYMSGGYVFFWNTMRYYLYNVWLMNFGNKFDWYFIADVRDVLFQSDIFSLSLPKGVHLLSEIYNRSGKLGIEGCGKNEKWIKPFNASAEVLKKPIINSGTILGSSKEIQKFIKEYTDFMRNEKKETAEQGVLNYFYYTRKFDYPVFVYPHEEGYCLSIHTDFWMFYDVFIPINGTLYDKNNKIAVCIHGWDHAFYVGNEKRKEEYRKLLKKRVGIISY